MLILNGGGLPTLERCRAELAGGETHLGRLARPRHCGRLRETLDRGFRLAFDNDAFSSWSLDRFVVQLSRIEQAVFGRVLSHSERIVPGFEPAWYVQQTPSSAIPPPLPARDPAAVPAWHPGLLWLTVPDVPLDAAATGRRWQEWAPLMSRLPLALCIQDGAGDVGIPWGWPGLRCLFMAGSTEYKLSDEMAAICREGKRRGLWIHAGRVNSRKRIRYLLGLEFVDSIDGTGFDRFRGTHLPWGLAEVSATSYQLVLAPEPR